MIDSQSRELSLTITAISFSAQHYALINESYNRVHAPTGRVYFFIFPAPPFFRSPFYVLGREGWKFPGRTEIALKLAERKIEGTKGALGMEHIHYHKVDAEYLKWILFVEEKTF